MTTIHVSYHIYHICASFAYYYVNNVQNPLICLGYPGHSADGTEIARLNKLAAFQKKALTHALSCKIVDRF